MHGRDEKGIQYFSRKAQGKKPLGRHRRRWADNIKIWPRERDQKGETCTTHRKYEKCVQNFELEKRKGRDHV